MHAISDKGQLIELEKGHVVVIETDNACLCGEYQESNELGIVLRSVIYASDTIFGIPFDNIRKIHIADIEVYGDLVLEGNKDEKDN